MSTDVITNYVAVKTFFFEEGRDNIDLLGNIVLHTMPDEQGETVSLRSIINKVATQFSLEIPLSFLMTIMKRLKKKKGYISYNSLVNIEDKVWTTEDGNRRKNEISNAFSQQKREQNALILSLKKFMQEKHPKKIHTEQKIKDYLNSYIQNNPYLATGILQGDQQRETDKMTTDIFKVFTNYFKDTERNDPDNFERLKSILLGQIICANLFNRQTNNVPKLENVDVYIDTNVFFSLMGLHEPTINNAVADLFDLIKKIGLKVKVFSHTKDEICTVLKGYLRKSNNYSQYIPVYSIYHGLKKRGFDPVQVMSLIGDIENKFNKYGIQVDYSNRGAEVRTGDAIYQKIQECKRDEYKSERSIEHDYLSFALIRKIRGVSWKNYYFIEKCKSIFLTLDKKLAALSSKESMPDGYIPEVILESELTGILWLKNFDTADNVFVHNFLEYNLQARVIGNGLWEKFIEKLHSAKQNNDLNDETIAEIISQRETESILLRDGIDGFDQIINDAKIGKTRNDLIEKNQAIISLEREKAKLIEQQLESIGRTSKAIETECQKESEKRINTYLNIIIFALVMVSSGLLYLAYTKLALSYAPFLLVTFFMYCAYAMRIKTDPLFNWLKRYCTFNSIKLDIFVFDLIKFRQNYESKRVSMCVTHKKTKYKLEE